MDLIKQWLQAKDAEKAAQEHRRAIEQEIQAVYANEIADQLDSDYGTGTSKIADDNGCLLLSYPKKVEWDNEVLCTLWSRIANAGEDPSEYIDRNLSVSETKYKSLPSHIRDTFTPARTVKAGNPTFSYKESK